MNAGKYKNRSYYNSLFLQYLYFLHLLKTKKSCKLSEFNVEFDKYHFSVDFYMYSTYKCFIKTDSDLKPENQHICDIHYKYMDIYNKKYVDHSVYNSRYFPIIDQDKPIYNISLDIKHNYES